MELEPIEMPVAASSPAPAPAASGPTTSTSSSNLFDLETYISRYESNSETRLQRLLLVASVSASQSSQSSSSGSSERMAEQAYRLAERQCRDAANVRTYRQVFGGQVAMGAAAGSGSGGEF